MSNNHPQTVTKTGRTSKYTPAVAKKIVDLIRQGAGQEQAALLAGISTQRFYEYKKIHAEFQESCARANAEYIASKATQLSFCVERAIENSDYRTAIPALIEILKRRDKVNWSERLEQTGADGSALHPQLTVEDAQEGLKRLIIEAKRRQQLEQRRQLPDPDVIDVESGESS